MRDRNKAKESEGNKQEMDTTEVLPIVIQGGNRCCSVLLCQGTQPTTTYTDLLDCIMKERGASTL